MAFLKGKDGVVYFGTPKAKLGHVQNWNLDEEADTVDGWGMGDTYETSFTTIKRFSGATEVYMDPTAPQHTLKVGDEIALELYPGGETTGSAYFSGNVTVTAAARSADKGGIPTVKISFKGRGALTQATKV